MIKMTFGGAYKSIMRLVGDFELVDVDQFEKKVIAHGDAEERFGSFLEASESGNYIFQFLMEDTTIDEVIRKMCDTFDAPEADIREDVNTIVDGLRALGYLDE